MSAALIVWTGAMPTVSAVGMYEPVMTVETLGAQPVLYGHLDAKKAREVFTQTLAGKSAKAYVVYVGTEPSDIGRGKGGKA